MQGRDVERNSKLVWWHSPSTMVREQVIQNDEIIWKRFNRTSMPLLTEASGSRVSMCGSALGTHIASGFLCLHRGE